MKAFWSSICWPVFGHFHSRHAVDGCCCLDTVQYTTVFVCVQPSLCWRQQWPAAGGTANHVGKVYKLRSDVYCTGLRAVFRWRAGSFLLCLLSVCRRSHICDICHNLCGCHLCTAFVRLFVIAGRGPAYSGLLCRDLVVVQCACPGRGGELVAVCVWCVRDVRGRRVK